MKRIRRRQPRTDRLTNQIRERRANIGRWVYLTFLTCFLIWLGDMLFGRYLVFRADGLVTQDRVSVAVTFPARISALRIDNGDWVEEGEVIANVISIEVLDQIATLSSQLAEIAVKETDLKARDHQLKAILPLARKRAADMTTLRSKEERSVARGLTSDRLLSQLLEDEFDAQERLGRLQAERANLSDHLATISEIRAGMESTLAEISEAYADGKVVAPRSGVVNGLAVNPGTAVRPGDTITDILIGERYVLAYITPGSLARVEPGDPVTVRYGVENTTGTVRAVLPFSARLPAEFQRAFRPSDRARVTRISLTGDEIPATFTKVRVTTPWFGSDADASS